MMRVAIIDYDSGNLHSAHKAFERAAREAGLSVEINITASADDVAAADRIVLPGVGAFADCRAGLDAVPEMTESLQETVTKKARPFLGICVGQQMMAERGLEKVETPGLGWLKGDVVEISPASSTLKIPHMGWNTLEVVNSHPLLDGIPVGFDGWHAYFVHSYHIKAANDEECIAVTNYGGPVTAMVGRDNIAGTQFHPEKSQRLGLALITNFLRWSP